MIIICEKIGGIAKSPLDLIYVACMYRGAHLVSPRDHTLTSPRNHTPTSPRPIIPSPHLDFLIHVFIPSPHLDIHTLTSPRLFDSCFHTLTSPRFIFLCESVAQRASTYLYFFSRSHLASNKF